MTADYDSKGDQKVSRSQKIAVKQAVAEFACNARD